MNSSPNRSVKIPIGGLTIIVAGRQLTLNPPITSPSLVAISPSLLTPSSEPWIASVRPWSGLHGRPPGCCQPVVGPVRTGVADHHVGTLRRGPLLELSFPGPPSTQSLPALSMISLLARLLVKLAETRSLPEPVMTFSVVLKTSSNSFVRPSSFVSAPSLNVLIRPRYTTVLFVRLQ